MLSLWFLRAVRAARNTHATCIWFWLIARALGSWAKCSSCGGRSEQLHPFLPHPSSLRPFSSSFLFFPAPFPPSPLPPCPPAPCLPVSLPPFLPSSLPLSIPPFLTSSLLPRFLPSSSFPPASSSFSRCPPAFRNLRPASFLSSFLLLVSLPPCSSSLLPVLPSYFPPFLSFVPPLSPYPSSLPFPFASPSPPLPLPFPFPSPSPAPPLPSPPPLENTEHWKTIGGAHQLSNEAAVSKQLRRCLI